MGTRNPIKAVCDRCHQPFNYIYGPAHYARDESHFCAVCSKESSNSYKHGLSTRDKIDPAYSLWAGCMTRSKKYNVPFDLEPTDITIPDFCPVLGIRLYSSDFRGSHDNSPSIDRIYPERGYVKDNIVVVSILANRIKNSATPDQIGQVYYFYKKLEEVI